MFWRVRVVPTFACNSWVLHLSPWVWVGSCQFFWQASARYYWRYLVYHRSILIWGSILKHLAAISCSIPLIFGFARDRGLGYESVLFGIVIWWSIQWDRRFLAHSVSTLQFHLSFSQTQPCTIFQFPFSTVAAVLPSSSVYWSPSHAGANSKWLLFVRDRRCTRYSGRSCDWATVFLPAAAW